MSVRVCEESVEPAWYVVRNDEGAQFHRELWNNMIPKLIQDGGYTYPKMIPLPPGASLQFVPSTQEWPEGEGQGEKWCKVRVGGETGWVPEWSVCQRYNTCVIKGPYPLTPVLACAPSCKTLDEFVQRHVGALLPGNYLSPGLEWPDQMARQMEQLTDHVLTEGGTLDNCVSATERIRETCRAHLQYYDCNCETLDLPRCILSPWKPHPWAQHPQGLRSKHCKNFSHEEWYEAVVEIGAITTGNLLPYWHQDGTKMSDQSYFHGCTLGAFVGMCNAGGFIAGPGSCRKNSRRSVSGAFCTENFLEAFDKGQNHMLDLATCDKTGNQVLNALCMPVVIELHPCTYQPTHMHGKKHCFECPIGQLVPGCCIKAVHMNKILLANFLDVQHRGVQLSMNPYELRICGQNNTLFHKGPVYQGSCGKVLTWDEKAHSSNSGIWYCKACAKLRVSTLWNDNALIRFSDAGAPRPLAPAATAP